MPLGLAVGCASGYKQGPEYLAQAMPWIGETSKAIPELSSLITDSGISAIRFDGGIFDPPIPTITVGNERLHATFTLQGRLTSYNNGDALVRLYDAAETRREPVEPMTESESEKFDVEARALFNELYPDIEVGLQSVNNSAAGKPSEFDLEFGPWPSMVNLFYKALWNGYPIDYAHLSVSYDPANGELIGVTAFMPELPQLNFPDKPLITEEEAIEKAIARWRESGVELGDLKPTAELCVSCPLEADEKGEPRLRTARSALTYAVTVPNPGERDRAIWIDSRDGSVVKDNSTLPEFRPPSFMGSFFRMLFS